MRTIHASGPSRYRLLALATLLALTAVGAVAQTTFEYNVQPRTLRACRLLIPYPTGGGNWASQPSDATLVGGEVQHSLIFEGMRRFPEKPVGWDIDNPFAAGGVLKNDPRYWEVPLEPGPVADLTPPMLPIPHQGPVLSNYDLIYIYAGGGTGAAQISLAINRSGWRQKLQQAVYDGAVLWIDQNRADTANYGTANSGLPVSNFAPPGSVEANGVAPFNFHPADADPLVYRRVYAGGGTPGDIVPMVRDWVLRYPFKLDDTRDIPVLGQLPMPGVTGISADYLDLTDAFHSVVVVNNGSGTFLSNIAVARYGAGAIVLTAGDVGYDVVNWWRYAQRDRPRSYEAPDCRFAWNVAALAASSEERGGGPNHMGRSAATVTPPLSINWQFPDRFERMTDTNIGSVVSTPATGRNMVFAVSLARSAAPARPPMLVAFDADPVQDLDDDGQADDGLAGGYIDYSIGKSYDMVWAQPLDAAWTPRWSSPTVTTMNVAGVQTEVVLVCVVGVAGTENYGEVRCFRANDGALIWTRRIDAYDAAAQVLDLTTPVVFEGYVFVLSSEYWTAADPGANEEDAYGRAHCFALNYGWTAGNQNGPQWVFPSPEDDFNGDGDADNSTPESPKSLPAFQDPYWVAGVNPFDPRPVLPPYPTQKPTLSKPEDRGLDLLLHCATPMTYTWMNPGMDLHHGRGGSDYVLVPTPTLPTDPTTSIDYLNARAYRVWLPQGLRDYRTQLPVTTVARPDDANIDAELSGLWWDPGDGRVYAYMRSLEAREYLLPSLDPAGVSSWAQLEQAGANMAIDYKVRPNDTDPWAGITAVTARGVLTGPIYRLTSQSQEIGWRRAAAPTQSGGTEYHTEDSIEDVNGNTVKNNWKEPRGDLGGASAIVARDPESGSTKWRYLPAYLSGDGLVTMLGRGNPAVDRTSGTVYAAVAQTHATPDPLNLRNVVPQVVMLNGAPRLRIQLRGGGPDASLNTEATLQIQTIDNADTGIIDVPPFAYEVEPSTKTINFLPTAAGFMMNVGPLWGKPVWVTYTPVGSLQVDREMHLLPDILRGLYSPEVIKLQNGIVRAGSVSFNLPNGVPLQRVSNGLDEVTYAGPNLDRMPTDVAGWPNGILVRGRLDARDLRMPGGERLLPGSEFMVTYDHPLLDFDAATGQWFFRTETLHERHQIPVNFGVPSGPVLAGSNLHAGTDGYLPTGERGALALLHNPEPNDPNGAWGPIVGFNGVRKSLLSVVADPITRLVTGAMSQTAIPEASTYGYTGNDPTLDLGTPATTASPAVDADGIVVGSRLMRRLSQTAGGALHYQGEALGFVSRLAPQRTLICDNTRLVEVTGQKPTWVCVGSLARHSHEELNVAGGADDQKPTPFSRPAKAVYLSNGNILVADTGNNRVIEIDRRGRQVWPLVGGVDYYTFQNTRLSLDRPSDCFRYYETVYNGVTYTSTNGNMLGATISHTIIADPGNSRVVDVVTDPLGNHRVDVLTPGRIRVAQPATMQKVAYTKAQPIFDPGNGACIGYLCAAANMQQIAVVERQNNPNAPKRVNPPSTATPPYGSIPWAWIAWLYDDDVTDGNFSVSNPLIFRNLRDMQLAREGQEIYLTLTCGQYSGRLLDMAQGQSRHFLSAQGDGVFEFVMRNVGGAWQRVGPVDSDTADPPAMDPIVTDDDPIWWFTRLNYLYSRFHFDYNTRQVRIVTDPLDPLYPTPVPRSLTHIIYDDVGAADDTTPHALSMAWNPVAAMRLPVDRRPVPYPDVANYTRDQRQARHMITNYSEVVQNLTRDNVADLTAPASLFSSVFVVDSDDLFNDAPEDDLHGMDRRGVIPDPNEPDWPDPFNQPAYADRR